MITSEMSVKSSQRLHRKLSHRTYLYYAYGAHMPFLCTNTYRTGDSVIIFTNISLVGFAVSIFSLLDSTLTLSNVADVVKLVSGSKWDTLGIQFNIPQPKIMELESLHPDVSQRILAILNHYLDEHPCQSWKLIAYTVYMEGEFRALEVIQRDYFKGH